MVTRTEIINNIISKYNLKSYLEIGVRVPGENFDKISIDFKESVDPDPKGECTYVMTSDVYFKQINQNKKYDIIFVDGLHTKEQVYNDVKNSIKHLNKNGFIVMHDCNPPTEYHIRSYEDYLRTRGQWNGDVFEGFIRLKTELIGWNCFVIDEDFGCGIITQNSLKKDFLPLNNKYENITWSEFDENRNILLDLISYKEFIELF